MGKLNVVLCWHMHQPDYRYQGAYLRPWTWLHAIKDYSDMAAHLENIPVARAVVNFSPVLIEQLQDYPARIRACLDHATPIRDEILDALAGQVPEGTTTHSSMPTLMRSLLRVNEAMMKSRFAAYARLHGEAKQALAEGRLLPRQQLDDLLVWYVLAWLGESVRSEALPVALQEKVGGYSAADRHALLQLVGEVCGGLLPRYRALAEAGRVELSVTPFAHPILPLLQELQCAHESMPHAPLPSAGYPGGTARCDWHLSEAVRVFRQAFGRTPMGCWPSEGGISEVTLAQLSHHGFVWTASGAKVLYNSLPEAVPVSVSAAHLHPWQMAAPGGEIVSPACFFRDDELSDRIGFEYSKWPAGDAVDDLVRRIEHSADSAGPEEAVLSIIMDGENAWEHFPRNAAEFLTLLYERLGSHPRIRLTTFSAVLPRHAPLQLSRLVAGSWVYGTFSTWVGDPAKNRAWDLLINAKSAVDLALAPELTAAAQEQREPGPWVFAVLRQLAVCEASDWFWWLGEDNRLEDGPAFDLLYRQQLAGLYQLISAPPPVALDVPINSGLNSASGPNTDQPPGMTGAMRSST